MTTASERTSRPMAFALLTIALGALGWFASFELLTEYVKTLQNTDYVPNCSISVLVSCGPNMGSWQGSLLGFSNTILGVSAFVAPIAVGTALAAGARFRPWFWWLYQLGLLGGFLFVCWLAAQSIFVLHTLCPWCMVCWAVTIPLFWISLLRPYAVGDVPLRPAARRVFRTLYSWSWVIIALCVIVIAAIAQFRLDWLAEFARA